MNPRIANIPIGDAGASPAIRTAPRPIDRAVTADLLARYDRPGPRYTSYPTALEFNEGVTTDDYLECLAAADALG